MAKFCQNCGRPLPRQAKYCPRCGIKIPAPVQPVQPTAEQAAQPAAAAAAPEQPAAKASASPGGMPYQAPSPFLRKWQTSYGASIGGLVVGGLIFLFHFTTHFLPFSKLFIVPSILVWTCVSIWYACGYLPSLFRADCTRGTSAATVSFANLLFGGVIFGLLWNSNLTSKKQGISNVVFAVCQVFCLLFWVIF